MRAFVSTIDGRNALLDWLESRPEAVSADIRDKLRDASRQVPVEACSIAARLIYARGAECPPTLQDLGAGLAAVMAAESFHSFEVDNLGNRMAAALRRDAGTLPAGVEPQDASLDPAPDAAFVKPPEPAEPPAGGPGE